MKAHEVGTSTQYSSMYDMPGADRPTDRFYSPALVELWRTGPYLHDGSAQTLRELLTTRNVGEHHGHTAELTAQELDDLVEYLSSL